MHSEWHIDLSTWPLTSECFQALQVRVMLWCFFCIFWVDWNCSGLKAASFRFDCLHHTQVRWLSPPSSADITSTECLHTLGLTFFLCSCSPQLSYLFRMIPQLINQRLERSSRVKWEFPVSTCCNNKFICTGECPPRHRSDASVSSPQAVPLFLTRWRWWRFIWRKDERPFKGTGAAW